MMWAAAGTAHLHRLQLTVDGQSAARFKVAAGGRNQSAVHSETSAAALHAFRYFLLQQEGSHSISLGEKIRLRCSSASRDFHDVRTPRHLSPSDPQPSTLNAQRA
jgi:hypothetical protein